MKRAVASGFEEFIAESTATQKSGMRAGWRSWPPAAREEIAEVLRRNDAGTAAVSASAMQRRLKDVHGVTVTRNQLQLYMQSLGRTGWRK